MKLSRKLMAGFAVAVLGGLAVLTVKTGWASFNGTINALGVDLKQPDAYISTPALSRLPRDLVKAPIARELLTEELAFYYEEHEDRLGLQGALKRIAFEHNTTLGDKLIEAALDQPAEIAMWADAKGAPRHWMMVMSRGVLARALEAAAPLAANDSQLSVISDIRANGNVLKVYALSLSSRRTLALVSQGDRVLVMSNPGLLFDAARHVDDKARDVIAALLSSSAKDQSIYQQKFGLSELGKNHVLVADGRLLSFGYQRFFPGLKALRVDVGLKGESLKTYLRVNGSAALPQAPQDRELWSALPMNPAACVLLPADWAALKSVGGRSAETAWASLAERMDGPAAICWYARSRLHTPLLLAHSKAAEGDSTAAMKALSQWLLPPKAPEIQAPQRKNVDRWEKQVTAPWGPYGEGEKASYKPTFARQGPWFVFSPDDALVEQALDAQAKRYPSVADTLPAGRATLAVLTPKQLADLSEREAFQVLGEGQAPLRQAAEEQLLPRLDALRKLPATQAVAKGAPDAQGWVAIDWLPLAATGEPALAQVPGR